ncbi:MAG: hypothetical protein WBX38_19085 [Candidatus Sulfotelmatobacter sp.]
MVKIPVKAVGCACKRGVLRLREAIRVANRLAPLRMTWIVAMTRIGAICLFMLMCCLTGWATTYYVSSSTGNDANSGVSSLAAWQTIAHVNAQSFLPGDSVLFKRGDIWNESLAPASSGSSGNPITFDAYGTGAAPNLSGYYAVPATAWVLVAGNAWKAPMPATYTTVNFCLFGSIWGQKVAAVSSNLTAQWDFYLANGYIYVYSVGNPASYYSEAIVPMALSNVPVINVNGESWLTFQHFLVNWFDQYGVYVQGASDHLVFANMEADSMIPQGTQPLGFYVNENAPGPSDIKIYNSEAHLNYDGFRFDGTATAIAMVNDKAYANRDGALVDNTGAVTYSYCHFYASSLAVAGSTDVEWTSGSGPTAGVGNIAADTAPAVEVYQRYPAEITLTVDDAGMTPGADTYYAGTVLPVADAAGVPAGAAITVGYPLAQTLISEFQGWINAGRDVTAHSMSHTYYVNTDALDIQYTGGGSAAALSVSNKTLTITVTGASDSVSYNLAQGQPQGTMLGLAQALAATGKYTYSFITPCQGPYGTGCAAYTAAALLSQDLANVSGQDVKSAVYHMQLNVTQLTSDEITLSRQWMTTNLTGLPATPVYVYPGGYETTAMQGIAEGVPFTGARGALKEDLGVKDTYADGFNAENITSFGVNPSWMGLQPGVLNQKIQALVWKEAVWGVPWGIFWHLDELTDDDPVGGTEITNLIQDFKNSGATVQTNTGLVNWLLSGTQETGDDGSYYYKIPAASMTLDFRPTKASPVVDAGENLGTAYALDINGVNQNAYGSGWEIGAHAYEGYAAYGGGAGPGQFAIGAAENLTAGMLPQVWVNNYEGDSLFSYELSLPSTWVTGPAPGCTFHTPYWTGTPTSAGLQSAINDIEACRTTSGVGLKLDIPPALYTSANGIVIPQTSSTMASNFLILDSTMDSNLPNGQTICSHGIQDNLATSTDIGLDNPDCAGDAMSYQLGNTVSAVPAGSITLANGTATNTSAYDDAQFMWTVEASGTTPYALQFCSPTATGASTNPPWCNGGAATTIGPDHWLIMDSEVRPAAGNKGNIDVINMHSATETDFAQLPNHIHFRKIWVHGDWTETAAGVQTGANSISAALALSCYYCSLTDSQTSQNLRPGAEGHSIEEGWTTVAKIDHNWISGQSIGSLCGGLSNPPSIPGLIPCTNMEWRRNRFTFPYAWLGQKITSNPNWPGTVSIVRKNAFEQKEGLYDIVDGNIVENVDNSGGQNGPYADWKSVNTSVGTGTNYQSLTANITITNNIFRNACNGTQMEAKSNGAAASLSYPSFGMYNITFQNDLFYNATESNPGCSGGSNGNEYQSNNAQWLGAITGNGSVATFTGICAPQVAGNCPSGPPPIGFQQMGINAGDAVLISGCTADTAFNTATTTIAGHTVPILAALANTPSSGLTVTFPSAATVADNSGTCQLDYIQGWPNHMQYLHNTFVNNLTWSITDEDEFASGPNYARNSVLRDSITTGGGWYNNPLGEGTNTELFGWDVGSLIAGHMVWPTRTASKYTEYESTGACARPAGCSPPATMYFPASDYCSGATPTSACVGFAGAMSASSMPMTLTDYHGFELLSGSIFKAGASEQASDGTDMGANIPAIDAAQTANVYVCGSACGSPGPYPDSIVQPIALSFFGFSESDTNGGGWPSASYNMQRFWDSPPLQWPSLNPSSGVFTFTNLDTDLALAYSEGATQGMYTLARTPPWASSHPTDSSCNYTTGIGGGEGECDAPSDLNSNGSGANAIWKAWVTAIATHVNSPGYISNHAHIKYWEIWNEPDTKAFFAGSIAQLARLTEDADCIITGRGVIHQNGNGSATPCTATPIDPTAQIVMASAHAKTVALTYGQNELYCNNTAGIPSYQFPCPNPPNAIAAAVDIINFHMKPGNESGNNCPAPIPCTPESAMQWYISNIQGILQPAELAKPLWDGEAQYSSSGFSGTYNTPDLAASFMPRFYLLNWSLGLSGMAWYSASSQAEPSAAVASYQQTYNWLSGAILTSPCAAAGTLWSCEITNSGTPYLIMWDTSQTCSSGSCSTANRSVGKQWSHYRDMTTASTPVAISGNIVPVGIKPVLIN